MGNGAVSHQLSTLSVKDERLGLLLVDTRHFGALAPPSSQLRQHPLQRKMPIALEPERADLE
jgi:hypothetical protein